ncbi:MAG: hypothetical protein HQK91_04685 [Nitrospirae bacterium]|nr:hypothetical protein [Nitrospirota bacterium]MBF0540730.1 hypothetical protein [Nitrospirota bacterium]
MKTKKISMVVGLIMIVSLILIGISFAKEGHQGGFGKMMILNVRWWQNPEIARKLVLTEDEKNKLDKLYVEKTKSLIDEKAAIQKGMLDMRELLEAKELDKGRILSDFKKDQTVLINITTKQFNYIVDVRTILGADRFKELEVSLHHPYTHESDWSKDSHLE